MRTSRCKVSLRLLPGGPPIRAYLHYKRRRGADAPIYQGADARRPLAIECYTFILAIKVSQVIYRQLEGEGLISVLPGAQRVAPRISVSYRQNPGLAEPATLLVETYYVGVIIRTPRLYPLWGDDPPTILSDIAGARRRLEHSITLWVATENLGLLAGRSQTPCSTWRGLAYFSWHS